jgi:hypothetical protein
MKPVFAAVAAIVLCTTLRVSAQDANRADALVSSWTLLALEHINASGEPTRARGARGLLILDAAGYAFEYFNAQGDEAAASLTTQQRAFAEHGGFWGRYEADAAAGRIAFDAKSGVSPNLSGIKFARSYEVEGDRLIVTSTDEPLAQRSARWIWQRVPPVVHLTPEYRQVMGFWEHVEERRVETATGEVLSATRRGPSVIVYTPAGFVGVYFPALNRAGFAAEAPTAEEATAAMRGYIGYWGTLSVYPGEVAHNILGGVSPMPGSILRRGAAVTGDELVVTLQNTGALITGEPGRQHTTVQLRRLSDADDMLPR